MTILISSFTIFARILKLLLPRAVVQKTLYPLSAVQNGYHHKTVSLVVPQHLEGLAKQTVHGVTSGLLGGGDVGKHFTQEQLDTGGRVP